MARGFAILAVGCLLLAAPAAGDNGHSLGEVQAKLSATRQKEARLTQQISGLTSDIRKLEARVGDVSQKLSTLEADLVLHERRLDKLDDLYAFETERFNFLRRSYATAVHQLNLRMIDLYETHDPTLVEVILESESFQDALDRIHYLDSIAQQDKHIAAKVAVARDAVRVSREQTKVVRTRVHAETQVVAVRTAQQRDVRDQLVASRSRLAGKRARQQTALKLTRQARAHASDRSAGARSCGRVHPRPARRRAGRDRYDSLRRRVDLARERAGRRARSATAGDACTPASTSPSATAPRSTPRPPGRSSLAGWVSGYGNYTCIDHGGGLATCYGAPVLIRGLAGRVRLAGPGDRLRRLHRPLLRASPPLRGADQRRRPSIRSATSDP